MKKPSDLPAIQPAYLALQTRLKELLGDKFPDTRAVRAEMHGIFQRAFELTMARGTRAYSTVGDLKRIFPDLMDHPRVYNDHYRQNLVVVTEPYSKLDDNSQAIDRLEFLGCEVWDLSGWEYHNPGHCCCLGISLPRRSQKIVNLMAD